jgi:hypothetical protein
LSKKLQGTPKKPSTDSQKFTHNDLRICIVTQQDKAIALPMPEQRSLISMSSMQLVGESAKRKRLIFCYCASVADFGGI